MPDAFAPGPSHLSAAPLFAGDALLDAEKLDVYRIALEFQAVAGQLVPKRGYAKLRDQLDHASISIVLNIAERRVSDGIVARRHRDSGFGRVPYPVTLFGQCGSRAAATTQRSVDQRL